MRDSGIFFGGMVLGALFCAACGFDLFPGRPEEPSFPAGVPAEAAEGSQRLATELAEARGDAGKLREEMRGLRDGRGNGGEAGGTAPPQGAPRESRLPEEGAALAARLHQAIVSLSWAEAALRLDELLLRGEEGARLVVETVSAGFRSGQLPDEIDRLYPLLRVAARREEEVAGLITAALSSPAMEEPQFARIVYRLAPPFLSASPQNHSGARSALVQRLLAALADGSAAENLWWVLQGLSQLGVDAGVESPLARILREPAAAPQHGIVVVHLGRVASVEAVDALAAFVERSPLPPPPAVGTALRELARMPLPEAARALAGFLASPRTEIRDAATLAHFTRARGTEDAANAAGFLDCDAPPAAKRKLLAILRERSPDLLRALLKDSALVKTEAARSLLAREEPLQPAAGKPDLDAARRRSEPPPAPLEPAKK